MIAIQPLIACSNKEEVSTVNLKVKMDLISTVFLSCQVGVCEDVGDVYKIRIGYENPQGTPGGFIETVWNTGHDVNFCSDLPRRASEIQFSLALLQLSLALEKL